MRNVWKIIIDDFRLLFSNAISIVVVIGLCVVPGMYVWFNLAGMWDPYNSVDKLEVAIVNQDEGYKYEILPMDLEMGKTIVTSLHENQGLKWAFTDYDNAMAKLKDSSYYAVIVIPNDFSEQLMSILDGSVSSATLVYYSNEKSNPIAPKITGKGASAIQEKINSTFSSTIYSALLKTASNLLNSNFMSDANDVGITLNGIISTSISSIDELISDINVTNKEIDYLVNTIDKLKSELLSSDSDQLNEFYDKLNSIKGDIASAKSVVTYVRDTLSQYGITSKVVESAYSLICQAEQSANNITAIVDESRDAADSFMLTLDSVSALLKNTTVQTKSLIGTFQLISKDLHYAQDQLKIMSSSSSLEDIKNLLGNDTNNLANLITAPVQLERNAVFPMANNAASMSGFYISICVWVGALILAALLEANLTKKRKDEFKDKKLKNWQIYLGRYAVFGVISFVQVTFIALGCMYFLQIPVVHPVYFIIVIWLISVCYSLFIYTMLASFGSIGKALCVILLVLQIAATGGTFPIQLVIEPFQVISPYLPTTYSLRALNMCVAGFVGNDLLLCMFELLVTMIPLSLVMGLILRNPIIKLNENFKEKVSKAKLLGI